MHLRNTNAVIYKYIPPPPRGRRCRVTSGNSSLVKSGQIYFDSPHSFLSSVTIFLILIIKSCIV